MKQKTLLPVFLMSSSSMFGGPRSFEQTNEFKLRNPQTNNEKTNRRINKHISKTTNINFINLTNLWKKRPQLDYHHVWEEAKWCAFLLLQSLAINQQIPRTKKGKSSSSPLHFNMAILKNTMPDISTESTSVCPLAQTDEYFPRLHQATQQRDLISRNGTLFKKTFVDKNINVHVYKGMSTTTSLTNFFCSPGLLCLLSRREHFRFSLSC